MYVWELLGEVLFFTLNNFWQSLKTYFFSHYFLDTLRDGRADWPKPRRVRSEIAQQFR